MAKAISIKQPFAQLITEGRKKFEIRSRPTSYRGEIVICSSKRPHNLRPIPINDDMKYGMALCIATLVDCVPFSPEMEGMAFLGHSHGYFAFRIEVIERLQPFPVIGKLGIFTLSDTELLSLAQARRANPLETSGSS